MLPQKMLANAASSYSVDLEAPPPFACDELYSDMTFQPVMSDHGLLTTVAYKLGRDKPACYALEVCVCVCVCVCHVMSV